MNPGENDMNSSSYGFGVELDKLSVEEGVEKITAALSNEGFGVLTRIDVDKTLKEKLGAQFRAYSILGACHPQLALKALNSEAEIGLLMPCNVLVQENSAGSGITISAIDPEKLIDLVQEREAATVMMEAGALLRRAIDALTNE
tara:strand:- start:66 stop:497 length:432 start_codon:yes stop_codon:yes gene_type:complete